MKVVADRWVENWNPANAEKDIRQIIIETGGKFDAVVASNDGTALGALRALKEAGLAGKVFISGQDATAAGCNSIARRELTVTVLKDTRLFAPAVCEIAIKLARDEAVQGLVVRSLSEYMNDPSLAGNVCCKFLPVALITRENLKQLVVDSGFQSYEGVYAGVENPPPR
jgi:D-xylose transport system substrate-binding protein